MLKLAALAIWLAACGRLGFDPAADGTDADGGGLGIVSCTGLANTCGPAQTSNCCESPVVPGGTYARSYDVSGDGLYPNASYVATVSDFRLDKYAVTVGRFRQFVTAGWGTQASPPRSGSGAHPNIANSGWDPSWNASLPADTTTLIAELKCDATHPAWTDSPGGTENLPINCIDWFEAMAFCAWDGGFLPTEAEWNYVEAGGSEQRAYPWSDPPGALAVDCSYANYKPAGTSCVNPPNGGVHVVGSESPRGDGKWGHADLSGNVFAWMLDWYASPYAQNPCSDCANLTPATTRVIRGGSFYFDETYLRASFRIDYTPVSRKDIDVGIRCARTP